MSASMVLEAGRRPAKPWWSSASYWSLVGAVGAVSAVAIAIQAPLSYDGSSYLFWIFDRAAPFVPFGRYAIWLQQWPAVLAAQTGDYPFTRAAFLTGYGLTPVVLFAVAAALVWPRRRAYLPILVLGMLVSTFVAQTFYVAESVISVQIWWCAWAAFATPERPRSRTAVGCALAVLAVFTYLPAIALAAILMVTLWLRERRASLVPVAIVAAASVIRVVGNGGLSSGESQNAPKSVRDLLDPLGMMLLAGFGLVLLGLVLFPLCAVRPLVPGVLATIGIALMLGAMVRHDYFGLSEHISLWVLAVPTAVVGCVLLLRHPRPVSPVASPLLLGVWIVGVSIALASWNSFFQDFRTELAAVHRCAPPSSALASRRHWSMTTLSLVVEGPAPRRVILGNGNCADWNRGIRPLYPGQDRQVGDPGGKFDLPAPHRA
jgi:hypothetical protein